jgi:hypothetical protein
MRIDPAKVDPKRALTLLLKLSKLTPPREHDPNDWAAMTAASLKAGKLEDFDLVEFIAEAYARHLAGKDGDRRVWEYSRALLALAEESAALGVRSPKTDKVRAALSAWT